MAKHAKLSPSGAEKWIACPAAPAAEGLAEADDLNIYAAEGTAAHFLASEALDVYPDDRRFTVPEQWHGETIYINANGEASWTESERDAFKFPITTTMIEHVQKYLDALKDFAGDDGVLFSEVRLDISPITGEEGAGGTSDAVIIRGTELQVHDLKYGMKAVDAYQNKQLLIYAAAAVEEYAQLGYEFDQIVLVIHQPRVGNGEPSVCTLSVKEFSHLIGDIEEKAIIALQVLEFAELGADVFDHATPGNHCHNNYCKARDTCPALHKAVIETSSAMGEFLDDLSKETGFDKGDEEKAFDNERLGAFALKVPMIEAYCKSIMSRVTAEVLNGEQVPGFKAVMSRQGNREWGEGFEDALATTKIKKELVYKQVPLSPTELEKVHKDGKLSAGQWKKLSEFITRSDAKVTVAPISDKRPPVEVTKQNTADDFETLE